MVMDFPISRLSSPSVVGFPVGYRFLPKDKHLIAYYLFNKLFTDPLPFNDHEQLMVQDVDLYGSQEPWDIWRLYGGDNLEDDEALHFFTRLKKFSVNGSRICRRVGSGTWSGEDSGDQVNAGNVVGFKKRFRYENPDSPHDGGWIMHEFALDSDLLRDHQKPNDIVLCRMRKNPFGQRPSKKQKSCKFEPTKQSKRCKISVRKLSHTHTGSITQASEPEVVCPSLMFDSEDLLCDLQVPLQSSTIEPEICVKTNAGDSENAVDSTQHTPMTTTQADDSLWADMLKLPPLALPLCPLDGVDGSDCLWEDMMKNIPLPDELPCKDATNFWSFEVCQVLP